MNLNEIILLLSDKNDEDGDCFEDDESQNIHGRHR